MSLRCRSQIPLRPLLEHHVPDTCLDQREERAASRRPNSIVVRTNGARMLSARIASNTSSGPHDRCRRTRDQSRCCIRGFCRVRNLSDHAEALLLWKRADAGPDRAWLCGTKRRVRRAKGRGPAWVERRISADHTAVRSAGSARKYSRREIERTSVHEHAIVMERWRVDLVVRMVHLIAQQSTDRQGVVSHWRAAVWTCLLLPESLSIAAANLRDSSLPPR